MPFANEPTYPWNAVIVWNNPQGVQKLLYDRGYQPSATLADMYELTNKILSADPTFEKDLLSADPNKDKILKYFSEPSKEKHFSICNMCKSNYTGENMDTFKANMSRLPGDQLHRVLDMLKDNLREAAGRNDVDKQRDISARIDIVGSLLGMPPESIISAGGTGNVVSTTPPPATNTTTTTTTTQPGFSLANLTMQQKAVGLIATGIIGGVLLSMLFSGGKKE